MFLILEDGTRCPILHCLDIDGEETRETDMVCTVVAKLPDGTFIAQEVGPEMWVPAEAH